MHCMCAVHVNIHSICILSYTDSYIVLLLLKNKCGFLRAHPGGYGKNCAGTGGYGNELSGAGWVWKKYCGYGRAWNKIWYPCRPLVCT